jgi:oxygen-dependent protoporphyrinogen oxidase
MPGSRLFSWREGVGSLPAALAARLGDSVRTGVAVRRVVRRGRGFRVEAAPFGAIEARAVVIATQPHVAAQLLEPIDAAAAAAAAAIEAPPLAVVFLGYRTAQLDHPLDGVGYLTPSGESRGVTATLFCSTMFAGRAPEGHVALAAYVGGRRAPELALLPPPALVALAREELGELVGARGEPVVARVRQWPRGLPQLSLGHRRRAAAIGEAEDGAPGLFVTGNYFSGVSVSSCLEQALRAAAGAHAFLRRSQAGWRRTSAARDW